MRIKVINLIVKMFLVFVYFVYKNVLYVRCLTNDCVVALTTLYIDAKILNNK